MAVNLARIAPLNSSFLSIEKDTEIILRKLFVENRPYSDELKKLLVVNMPDCLTNNKELYQKEIKDKSLKVLKDEGYIRCTPLLKLDEFPEEKNYLYIFFDSFSPDVTNPEFRDSVINFIVVSHIKNWEMDNYCLRPVKIIGYIDSLLNKARLTGIGTLNFLSAEKIVVNEELAGYSLSYLATHGSDDSIPTIPDGR